MRSSCPEADIRMPVSTGRVSSREAERATREIVCTNASAGSVIRVSAVGLGSVGKSSVRSVRRWKVAGPQISSTSCSALRSSIVSSSAGSERATSSSRRAGSTAEPGLATSAFSGTRRPISMSVAKQLGRGVRRGGDHHAGQRLHGAARRRDPCDGLQLGQQLCRREGQLHGYFASRR